MTKHTAPQEPHDNDDAWLTMKEICARIQTPVDTAYKWAGRGYPFWPREASKLPNGAWRCRPCDVDAWMLAQPWRKVVGR